MNFGQVAVSMRIKSIMDINEVRTQHKGQFLLNHFQVDGFFQVQFYLTMKWFESRLKFQVFLRKDITEPTRDETKSFLLFIGLVLTLPD